MTDLYLNDKLIQSNVETGYKHSFSDLESDTEFKVELKNDGSLVDSKIVKTLPKKNVEQKYYAYWHYNSENKIHKLIDDSVVDMNLDSVDIVFSEKQLADNDSVPPFGELCHSGDISLSVSKAMTSYFPNNNYIFVRDTLKHDENAFIKDISHKTLGSIPDINFKIINKKVSKELFNE